MQWLTCMNYQNGIIRGPYELVLHPVQLLPWLVEPLYSMGRIISPYWTPFCLVCCVCTLQAELRLVLHCICMANASDTISAESFKVSCTTVGCKNVFFASMTRTSYSILGRQNLDASNELILWYASKMIVSDGAGVFSQFYWRVESADVDCYCYGQKLGLWVQVKNIYVYLWKQPSSSLCKGTYDSVSNGTVNASPYE